MSMSHAGAQRADKLVNEIADMLAHHQTIDKIREVMNQPFFDPNRLTKDRQSLLFLAIFYGRLDMVNALVKMRVNVNQRHRGKPLIQWAVQEANFEIIPYLIAQGASKKDLMDALPSNFPKTSSIVEILAIAKQKHFVNILQHKLLYKFLVYLKLQQKRFPKKYVEPYFSHFVKNILLKSLGICNGYTEAWLYKKCKKKYDLHILTLRKLPSVERLRKLKNVVPVVIQIIDNELNETIWIYGSEPDGSLKLTQVKNKLKPYVALFGELIFPKFDILQKMDSEEVPDELFLDIEKNRYHASLESLFWNDIYKISMWDEEAASLEWSNLHLLLMSKKPNLENLMQYQSRVPMLIKELDSQGNHKIWLMHYDEEGNLKLTAMKNSKAFQSLLFLESPEEILVSKVPPKIFQEIQSEVGNITPPDQRLDVLFEQMLSNLMFFHDPTSFLENTNQESFPDVIKVIGNQTIVERFKAPLLLTKEEIVRYLPPYLTEKLMMKFSSTAHTVGAVKDENGFHILDPDRDLMSAQRIQEFADLLSICLIHGPSDPYIEMAFVTYALTPPPLECKNIIQDKLALLEKIYQDRIKRGIAESINIQSSSGCTTLSLACSLNDEAAVDWCLAKPGVDVNLGNESSTPLFYAAGFGAFNVIQKLLKQGARIFQRKRGKIVQSLPLQTAIEQGYVEVVESLLAHAKKHEPDDLELYKKEFGHLLLRDALKSERVNMLEVLIRYRVSLNSIDYSVDPPTSLFIRAIQENKVDMVRKFLEYTADRLQNKNPYHYPLARALSINGNFASRNPLSVAVRLGHFAIAEALMKAGADIHFSDPITGISILAEALQKNNFNMVKLLVDHGVKITEEVKPLLVKAEPKIVSYINAAAKRTHSPEKKPAKVGEKKPVRAPSPQKKLPRAASPQKMPARAPYRYKPRKPR